MSSSVPIPGFTAFVHVKNMPAIKPVDTIATISNMVFILIFYQVYKKTD
jgi:hypothetical protein